MTISATTPEVSYAGDNTTVAFPIPFVFDTAADLKILSTDVDGNVSVITTGFTVSGGNRSTGTLTFGAAPAVGITITILDDPEREQATDYVSNDPFPAESHEHALDRGVRISKRLYQIILRCLRTQDGDPASGAAMVFPTVAARRGRFAMWSDDPIGKLEPAVGLPVGEPLSQSIIGGLLYPQTAEESAASVTPTNYAYPLGDIRRYGNDEAAINTAIAVQAQMGGGTILLEEGGSYTIDAAFDIADAQNLILDGQGATITSTSRITQLFRLSGASDHVVIRGVTWSPPAYAGVGSQQARMVAVLGNVDCLEIDHCSVVNGALITSESGDNQLRCNLLKITQCKADGGGDSQPTVPQINGMQIGGVRQVYIDQCEVWGYAKDQIKLTVSRPLDGGQLTNPFDTTNASHRVTVNWIDHPFLDGDRVTFDNASAVGGITIDGEYRINRKLSDSSFEIIHTAAAGSSASGGGTVDYSTNYPITEMVCIKRCVLRDSASGSLDAGVDIYGTGRHTIIEENLFSRLNTGVMCKNEVDGSNDLTGDVYRAIIQKNRFLDCANGTFVALADNCTIRDNEYEDCGLNAAGAPASRDIYVRGPLRGLLVENNTFMRSREFSINIDTRTVNGATYEVHGAIRGNRFYDTASTCIRTASSNNAVFALDISDNRFVRHGGDAIELRGYGGSLCRIEGNYFVDSAQVAFDRAASTATDVFYWGANHFVDHSAGGNGALAAEGTYTPTLTNTANISASIPYQCQYLRVGNTVTVSGRVDVTPTSSGVSTQLGISLPIPSNIGTTTNCAGVASSTVTAGECAGILGEPTGDVAQMRWMASSTSNFGMFFTFTYRII